MLACVGLSDSLGSPPAPAVFEVVSAGGGVCVLAEHSDAEPCRCRQLPAAARRLWGLPLSLDAAPVEDLQTLRGIGPRRAQQIVEARERAGRLESVEDLGRIPGIGPKTLASLRPQLFTGASDPACARPRWLIRSGAHRPD